MQQQIVANILGSLSSVLCVFLQGDLGDEGDIGEPGPPGLHVRQQGQILCLHNFNY